MFLNIVFPICIIFYFENLILLKFNMVDDQRVLVVRFHLFSVWVFYHEN